MCYWSAIGVHGLSTQVVAHHHVGILKAIAGAKRTAHYDYGAVDRNSPPIGDFAFRIDSVPYYTTSRDPKYVRDLQVRFLEGKVRYKVTSLEQTIVDTLHRPMSCGGPAVVFEAWETARPLLQSDVLLDILSVTQDDRLCRRIGYMMDRFDLPLSTAVRGLLTNARNRSAHSPIGSIDSLLTGIPYSTVDSKWQLLVP